MFDENNAVIGHYGQTQKKASKVVSLLKQQGPFRKGRLFLFWAPGVSVRILIKTSGLVPMSRNSPSLCSGRSTSGGSARRKGGRAKPCAAVAHLQWKDFCQ
jgi:hypothetical protein